MQYAIKMRLNGPQMRYNAKPEWDRIKTILCSINTKKIVFFNMRMIRKISLRTLISPRNMLFCICNKLKQMVFSWNDWNWETVYFSTKWVYFIQWKRLFGTFLNIDIVECCFNGLKTTFTSTGIKCAWRNHLLIWPGWILQKYRKKTAFQILISFKWSFWEQEICTTTYVDGSH